jgi:hypothetical protein
MGHGEAKDCGFFRSIINSNLEVQAAAKQRSGGRPILLLVGFATRFDDR